MTRSMFRRLSTCGVLVFLSCFARAEHPWLEIRSPHFRVLTNGSSQDGRKVANEFEQMRHVFGLLFKTETVDPSEPLTIYAVRNDDTFRQLEPFAWKGGNGKIAGNFISAWERQYAMVRLDSWGDENQVVVYHEYTHSILHARAHWLPIWMDEGIAEFYGYTRFENDRVLIGAPSKRMAFLRQNSLLPVNKMIETTNYSPLFKDEERLQMFYAESWAMVHYMIFGKGMGSGKKLGEYLTELEGGTPQQKVFEEIFGDTKAFDKGFSQYVDSTSFSAGVLPPDKGVDPKTFQERTLDPAEIAYFYGCAQVGSHDYADARKSLEKSIELNPLQADAQEELGYLDFDAGKDADAEREWLKALAINPSESRSLFATTMLHFNLASASPDDLAATQTVLRKVTELAPKFAPAYAELAMIEWKLGKMQVAYGDSVEAERLEPRRAGYHLLTGRILLHGNQSAAAANYARYVADHWYGPDHNEAVELFEAIPAAQRGDGVAPTLDVPAGAEVVRGRLVTVACGATPGIGITVTIKPSTPAGAPSVTFKNRGRFSSGFSDTFWWGEDHYSLCQHLTGDRVMVAHKGDEWVSLEAQDDLPDTAEGQKPR